MPAWPANLDQLPQKIQKSSSVSQGKSNNLFEAQPGVRSTPQIAHALFMFFPFPSRSSCGPSSSTNPCFRTMRSSTRLGSSNPSSSPSSITTIRSAITNRSLSITLGNSSNNSRIIVGHHQQQAYSYKQKPLFVPGISKLALLMMS